MDVHVLLYFEINVDGNICKRTSPPLANRLEASTYGDGLSSEAIVFPGTNFLQDGEG
jgi:hypothetical protein